MWKIGNLLCDKNKQGADFLSARRITLQIICLSSWKQREHNNQNTDDHQSMAVNSGSSTFDESQQHFFRVQLVCHTLLSTEFVHF